MAGESFVLRVFNGERELTPSTGLKNHSSNEEIDSAIETIFHGNYQRVGGVDREHNGEVRVKVVPKSATFTE